MTRPLRDAACLGVSMISRGWAAQLGAVLSCAFLVTAVQAQTYHNVSNRPFATVSNGPQEAIIVDIDGLAPEKIDAAILERARRVDAMLTTRSKTFIQQLKKHKRLRPDQVWPLTHIVYLRKDGKLLQPARRTGGVGAQSNDITLQFSTVQGEQFPQTRQDFINSIWPGANTRSFLTATYGAPYQGGPVVMVDDETTIGDHDAVVGGIYVVSDPAHNNLPTIFMPEYINQSTVAVNLVNLLAHAYHGPAVLQYDAWEQGFARAVTMQLARQLWPDSNPFSDGTTASAVIDGTYEARFFYDWWNQPCLGNSVFIAPSIRQLPIDAGLTGGPFLVRYMMAGSAWGKVLTEASGFFSAFNAAYYNDISIAGNVPSLVSLAQQQAANVEGPAFSDWFQRQFVLDSSVQPGRKLHTTVIPDFGDLAGETGVYFLIYNYFSTASSGDETLLTGAAYPIYWTFDFARMNLGPQYEQVDLKEGSAAIAPSFTENTQDITIDSPSADVISRVVLPLGTVATRQFSNNFFGTVLGLTETDPTTFKQGTVTLTLPSGDQGPFDITQGAFGATITGLDRPVQATLTIRDLNNNVVGTPRRVNTGPDMLALHTQIGQGTTVTKANNPIPGGPWMISVPIFAFEKDAAKVFGVADPGQFLFARWRQDLSNYALYPSTPPIQPGYGYFLNLDKAISFGFTVHGMVPPPNQPYAVPLQVGWNQIGNPILSSDTDHWDVSQITVQHSTDDPLTWADASDPNGAAWIGQDIFQFNPDGTGGGTDVPGGPTFDTWRGYFVRVLAPEGVTLLFSPPTGFGPHRPASTFTPKNPSGWSVDLSLTSEKGERSVALIGCDSKAGDGYDAHDVLLPPAYGSGLILAMPHDDWGAHKGPYYADVRPDGRKEEWRLAASGLVKGRKYTLTWPALSTMRRALRLTLVDSASGRRVNMRSESAYSFSGDGSSRQLRISVDPGFAGGLRVMGLTVGGTRGGTSLSFSLTQSADVAVTVTNSKGQQVRQLLASGAAPLDPGQHTVAWDQRDQRGISLPPGVYTLMVRAVSDDGTVARAVTPVVVKR